MADYRKTALKIKKEDGTFDKFFVETTVDSVLIDPENNVKLSDKLSDNGNQYSGNAATASSVNWSGVQNKPNTLEGFGITDAITSEDVVTIAEANKILKLDTDGKLPASITGDAATVGGKQATDFVASDEVVTEPAANKILKLDSAGQIPVNAIPQHIEFVTFTADDMV